MMRKRSKAYKYYKAQVLNLSASSLDFKDDEQSRLKKIYTRIKIFLWGRPDDRYKKVHQSKFLTVLYALTLMLCTTNIIGWINLSLSFNAMCVLIVAAVTTVGISAGMAFTFTFLAKYSNSNYINVWNFLPIFRGIGYSVMMFQLGKVATEACAGGIFLNMFINTVFEIPWPHCMAEKECKNYIESQPESRNDVQNQTESKCIRGYEFMFKAMDFGSFKYLETVTQDKSYALAFLLSKHVFSTTYYTVIMWIMVILPVLVSSKITKLIMYVSFGYAIGLCFIVYTYIMLKFTPDPGALNTDFQMLNDCSMWIQVVSYIIQEDMPFLWPTIGYLSKTTALRELVCGILAIRFMCIVYAIILVPYVAAGFKELARMPKHICSAINGIYLLYIMVTECLREIPIMVPLYYLAFALICFLYMSVCMKCILMGLMEAFPLIYRLRNSLRIIFIFVWTSVSIAIIYVDVLRLMYIIQLRIFYVVSMVLLIFSAMGLGIYGLNRIDGDYYFLHNKHFFAIKNLKITLVFLLMISIAFIFEMYRTYNQSVYIFYMLALICLMPIPIGAFLNRKHGCNISPDWTPVHSTMKARRLFNTKNMYVYRQEKACMHVCLKNDERLKREIASML